MIKSIKRAFKVVIIICMIIITIFNVYNLINTKILGNDLTIMNNRAILEVASGSMEPNLKVGDLIIIQTNDYNYKPGDIVTFKDSNGSFVTHRIVTISGNEAITRGDANNTVDKPIMLEKIVGKYKYKLSYLGHIMSAFRNTSTLVIVLVIGTIICFVLSLKDSEEKDMEEQLRKEKEFEELLNTHPIKTIKDTKVETKKTTKKSSTKAEVKKAPVKKVTEKPAAKKTTAKKTTTKKATTVAKKGSTKKVNK
ncbi:MAG: signal peptidase I [Firmicutes bacterium]|jgi:signal peptidase|nr:signal peptidase I [Bacillota bacterium]